jgi:adenylate cyclase
MTKRRKWLRFALYSIAVVACTLVSDFIGASSLGQWAELRTYDLRFKLRGPLTQSDVAPVVILAIDDEALAAIPEPMMLWQGVFARVLNQLAANRAGVVGVDFIFADIEKYDPEGQQLLSQSLLQAGADGVPVVLAYQVKPAGIEQPPPALRLAALAAGHVLAFVNLTTDSDDFVRRQEIRATVPGREAEPGFALAISEAFAGKYRRAFSPPGAGDSTILINFRGPGHFKRISFAKAAAAAGTGDAKYFADNFRDRIVLIGRVGGLGDEDLHSTPLYFWRGGNAAIPARTPGVEIHANTIATLLEGSRLRPLPSRQAFLVSLLLILSVSLLCFFFSPMLAPGLSAAAILGYVALAAFWMFPRGWWLPVAAPFSGAVLAVSTLEILDFIHEGREKRRLREMFRRYVNNEVIEKILQSPDALALQGQRREITVLFADIKNFTARSETMRPENLVRDLTEYFTAMVRVIQSHHGMVDKFIGDGIMAIFGAPIEDPESALRGVQAAQSMSAALKELNGRLVSRGAKPIAIGIGIHTGEAVVGNIGSEQKMEYTAIGDVVNVASRIEGLTRKFNTGILISGSTFQALKGAVAAQSLGEEVVKGRVQPVPIYGVDS